VFQEYLDSLGVIQELPALREQFDLEFQVLKSYF
jgi:hypothetical protein